MYQAWTEFIRQKRRYEGNKIQPYDDLAFSVFLYWIPIEIFVPLVLESSVTSKITARRRTSSQKAWLGVQTSSPPKVQIRKTDFRNFSINSEPFLTIPTALCSLLNCLSNAV